MSVEESKVRRKEGADGPAKKRPSGALVMVLFSVTIFVSAALLFLVEPMFAKFILPLFGSTPQVWTASMMFFQAALLMSYLYVHVTTTWLGARKQAVLHLGLVLLPLLLFVFSGPLSVPSGDWAPAAEGNPIFLLLGLMAVAIGLPFFAISATNPLIQRWLADTDHPAARDPYFLYRASNLGSVIGLLGYPLVVERQLTLEVQGIVWSVSYGLLVVLVAVSAVLLWRSNAAPAARAEEAESLGGDPISGGGSPQTGDGGLEASGRITIWRRLRWVGLTFVPSSLMLGVTTFITTDITPVPLLWVIPLSLYLLSFVIVFSPSQRMPDALHKAAVAALPVVIMLLVLDTLDVLGGPYYLRLGLHILGFFVVALALHGEVARDRPPARHLTEFYLWVSVGGVLGGIFNALVAPLFFDTVVEYPLAIVLAGFFLPGLVLARLLGGSRETRRDSSSGPEGERDGDEEHLTSNPPRSPERERIALGMDIGLPLALGAMLLALGLAVDEGIFDGALAGLNNLLGSEDFDRTAVWYIFIGLAVGLCLMFAYSSFRPVRFGLGIAAVVVVGTALSSGAGALYEDRSFFGVYRITGDDEVHTLVFGETNHGSQILGIQPPVPTTYYHETGPVGQAFDALPEDVTSRPAVVGLGTGTMACYNRPGQQMTFYEIDPQIAEIANDESLFTYLRDCPGENDIIFGDARLSLANAADGGYGIMAVDAFSSDAIPVHLMTQEAIELYFDKLQDNGVLLMHISNRHLELEPVLGNVAGSAGLSCRAQYDQDTSVGNKFASHWVAMSRQDDDLGDMADDPRWLPCETEPGSPAWTDDFSNLLSTFQWE